ncbi:MAG: Rid family hydrolase [Alphaproteobacteria bacterium]|nr:Rid family hydrolase [Alphaproteobacteria bacterium]
MTAQALECFTTGVLPAELRFCSAVRVGDLVFVSGNIGNVAGEVTLVEGGVAAETRQCLEHMKTGLEAADSAVDRVVEGTVFPADIADFQAVNEVYAAYFGGHRPARSTVAVNAVAVNALAASAQVEIECIALAG